MASPSGYLRDPRERRRRAARAPDHEGAAALRERGRQGVGALAEGSGRARCARFRKAWKSPFLAGSRQILATRDLLFRVPEIYQTYIILLRSTLKLQPQFVKPFL